MNIQPIGKKICVKVLEEEVKKEGKFMVADGARENKPLRVENMTQSGDLKVGDVLYIQPYGYTAVGDYLIVPADLILCRID